MAITAETRNSIIELVVTAYDAAPGTTLLTELITIINEGGTLADVATELTTSDQWNATYPIFQTAEEFAAEWLGKLLAEADADTLALAEDIVVGLINDGASAADLIMVASDFLAELDVEDELLGSSAAGFANKVEVATYFTVTLEQDGTQDELAAAIAGVSSDEDSVDAGKDEADSIGTPGTLFSLTKDVDDITGSAGDDTITAEPGTNATTGATTTTINSGDAVDGAGGEDTLNITATGANNNSLSGLTVTGVEVINITNADNFGGNTGAVTAATEAAADAEAALATAQAATTLATAQKAAADEALDLIEAGEDDVVEAVIAASSVANASSVAAAFQYLDDTYVEFGYEEVEAVLELTEAPAEATAFTLAQLQAAATAALTNIDGTTSTGTGDDVAINNRMEALLTANDLAYHSMLGASSGADAVAALDAAYTDVETLAGESFAAVTLAAATDSITEATQVAAAYEYLEGTAEADTVAEMEAIGELTELPDGVTEFTLAQYQAAALSTLSNDDGEAYESVEVVEAVTESAVVTFTAMSAGQSVTVAGATIFTTIDLTATEVAEIFSYGAATETGAEIVADAVAGTVVEAGAVTGSGTLTGFDSEGDDTNTDGALTFDSETAATDVTDITTSSVGGYELTVETTDGVAAVTAESADSMVDARLDVLIAASEQVVTTVNGSLAGGSYTTADLQAAIDASSVNPLTGEDYTGAEAAGVGSAADALLADYEAAAAYAASGDMTLAQFQDAVEASTVSATGVSLLDETENTAAIDARATTLAAAAETVLEDATEASDAALTADTLAANDVTVAGGSQTNGSVNAGQFAGAEQVWLKGASNNVDVTGATTQTIGLSGLSSMSNSIAFGSASGSVYLAGSSGDLTITGAKALSISGTTGTVDVTAASSTSVAIDMSGSNTLDLSAATALTSVTVSGEGASSLTLGSKVKTITSTDGGVSATISTATVVDDEGTTTDETVSASVTTSDAGDTITVSTTGTGTTAVSTGDGDDVVVMTRSLNSRDSIDGGDGADTIAFVGSNWTAQDYVVLDAAVSGFEVGAFYAVPVTADVSQLGFPVVAAQAGGTFTEASGAAITTWATTSVASTDFDDSDADDIVYGGDLNVTMTGGTPLGATTGIPGGGTLTLEGSAATVTVAATSNGDITSTIDGNVETLTVVTANSASSTTDRTSTVTITVAADENEALSSVTVSGPGSVVIDSSGAGADIELDMIDASALGGTLTKGTATAGNITGGLTVTTNADIAETVMLGSGTDVVTANSTYENMDTISGADFVKETDNLKSTTDTIVFGGVTLNGDGEDEATEVELTAGATSLGLAFVEAAAAAGSGTVYFHFGGDTYVYNDGGNDILDDSDAALKIIGLVDLDTDWGVYDAG